MTLKESTGNEGLRVYSDTTAEWLLFPDARATFEPKGLIFSNDLGYVDNSGNLHIDGRAGDWHSIGGENVNISDIERAAEEVSGVVAALVYLNGGASSKQLTMVVETLGGIENLPKVITSHLIRRISPRLIPGRIVEGSVPKLPNGKVDRSRRTEQNSL